LSGSGKTELARQLSRRLPGRCEILPLDAYYLPQAHLSLEERAVLNFDHPDALDWEMFREHLDALRHGKPVEEPIYLFAEHTRAPEKRIIEPSSYLIVEGILALHDPEIRKLLDLKVFVNTRREECLRRRIRRDISERGRTRESVLDQFNATVWPMAREFVLPSRRQANLVVSGEEPLEHSIGAVLRSLPAPSSSLQVGPFVATPGS
jgi:uridine kinase